MKWRPIDTAPKDGSRVLGFTEFDLHLVIKWCDDNFFDEKFGWTDDDGGCRYSVTHWMPLPKPPKE